MTYYCYNETCGKELVKNHTSWFCCESCRDEYWAFTKKKRPTTVKEMQAWLGQMREYYLTHNLKEIYAASDD